MYHEGGVKKANKTMAREDTSEFFTRIVKDPGEPTVAPVVAKPRTVLRDAQMEPAKLQL